MSPALLTVIILAAFISAAPEKPPSQSHPSPGENPQETVAGGEPAKPKDHDAMKADAPGDALKDSTEGGDTKSVNATDSSDSTNSTNAKPDLPQETDTIGEASKNNSKSENQNPVSTANLNETSTYVSLEPKSSVVKASPSYSDVASDINANIDSVSKGTTTMKFSR